jgi:hypothetical protein
MMSSSGFIPRWPLDSLKRLLSLGASPNGPQGGFVTPLQVATKQWDLACLEILLNAEADPNARRGKGMA